MNKKIEQVKKAFKELSQKNLHIEYEKIELMKALHYFKHNASIEALEESNELVQRIDGSYTIKVGGLAKINNALNMANKALKEGENKNDTL